MQFFNEFHSKLISNTSQLALNKFGQNLMFPNSKECSTRRDYILHRIGATVQQISILRRVKDLYTRQYVASSGDTGEKLQITLDSINQLSYCFDNLIFNLGSLSDYFGNYLGLFIYGPKCQTLKWSGFVNKTNSEYKNHPFGALVASENREWLTKLHEYRGDIIHRKLILVEVKGFENKKVFPHTADKLDFEINDALKKYFHIFRKGEDQSLEYCAEMVCQRTLAGFSDILDASENISFDDSFKNFLR